MGLTGGHLLARALRACAIDTIFGICGDHVNGALDACAAEGLRFVGTRHETGAVHMADAWARVTGRPAAVIVTGGPGHTNTLTGLGTAQAEGSPVLVIAGASDGRRRDAGAAQDIDQVAMARPVTKWAQRVEHGERLPFYVDLAYRHAISGRPGPVHLTVPVDVLDGPVDATQNGGASARVHGAPTPDASPGAHTHAVDRAIDHLARAARPLIVAGSGVWWAGGSDALQAAVDATRTPCFTISMGRGCLPDDHSLCFGDAQRTNNPVARAMAAADVVVVVGQDIDARLGYGHVFADDAVIVHIDADPVTLRGDRAIAVAVVADVRAFLDDLTRVAAERADWGREPWLRQLEDMRRTADDARRKDEAVDTAPMHPRRVVRELRDATPHGAICVFDGGDFAQWARSAMPARGPGQWLRHGSFGSIGASIPFAVAAKLARPDAPVIAFIGDGAFGFHSWELETAARERAPVVIVVGNNGVWGMEHALQARRFGRTTGADLGAVRYDRWIESVGGHGQRVDAPADLGPALRRAFDAGVPACIDVAIANVPGPLTQAHLDKMP